jgi:very-short-patch-repair endonuclease
MRTRKELKIFAQRNKNRDVFGESIFRKALLSHNIHYQRQKVVGQFIVDFYLPKRNLIVEIDGKYHADRKEYDEMRENWLKTQGYIILRFTDNQVIDDVNFCVEQILCEQESSKKYRACKERLAKINGVSYKPKNNKYFFSKSRIERAEKSARTFSCEKRYHNKNIAG